MIVVDKAKNPLIYLASAFLAIASVQVIVLMSQSISLNRFQLECMRLTRESINTDNVSRESNRVQFIAERCRM